MKQTYLALFLLFTLAMASCRKSGNDIDIKTYDNNQIQAYISSNGLSTMKRDTVGGDTTGIYYQITRQGRGAVLNYDTRISFSYTIRSLDGKYVASDTISNRSYNAVGLLAPKGLMMVMHDVIKNKGTSARILIPSRLAYGRNGTGAGSNRLPGNESLDYTINVLDNDNATAMAAYDDLSIRNYCKVSNIDINSYTKMPSGLYVKVGQTGTGTTAVSATSTLNIQYYAYLLNGTVFNQFDDVSTNNVGTALDMQTALAGQQQGLIGLTAGAKVDLLVPSNLGFGLTPQTTTDPTTGGSVVLVPTLSCLRYTITVVSVAN